MEQLSIRERAILHQLRRGKSNRQIARELGMTEAAVKAHLARLFRKIGCKNRSEAKQWASDNNI
jgi:DNA-binding CsgD family transcriptional regulator